LKMTVPQNNTYSVAKDVMWDITKIMLLLVIALNVTTFTSQLIKGVMVHLDDFIYTVLVSTLCVPVGLVLVIPLIGNPKKWKIAIDFEAKKIFLENFPFHEPGKWLPDKKRREVPFSAIIGVQSIRIPAFRDSISVYTRDGNFSIPSFFENYQRILSDMKMIGTFYRDKSLSGEKKVYSQAFVSMIISILLFILSAVAAFICFRN